MIKLMGRTATALVVLCAGLALAAAQGTWPQKAIKMIVPFAAGGGTDQVGRLAAKHLSDRLGQQVFVENRGGANGILGLQALMQSEPDGYTIGNISDTPLTVNPSLYDKLPYNSLRDFLPIAQIIELPGMLAVHPSVPARTVAELIALAKAKPGTLAYSSGGPGNFGHLAMELFSIATETRFLHVPYKGTGPGTQALLAGDVQVMINNVTSLLPHIQAKTVIPIAMSGPQRLAIMPELPTVAETVPNFDVTPWNALFAPAGTPKEIVARLAAETKAMMQDPELLRLLHEQQITPKYADAEELQARIKREIEKWGTVIKTAGIKPE